MTRSQRRWHAYLWIVLGPLILLGLLAALFVRSPIVIAPEQPHHAAATPPPSEERP